MSVVEMRSGGRQLKTLSRSEPDFVSYLDGSFSNDLIALPLRSLNVGTKAEEVTFEIVPVSSIARPSALKTARYLVRPSSLIFSVAPMLTVLSRAMANHRDVNLWLALSCFVGVLAFQIATNLFNDYGDHMRGQDRVRPKGGTRAIQNGWVRAILVKRAAWGLTGFAALCGIPTLLKSPALIMAGFAFLYTLEFAFQRLRLKARGWSEGLAFLLTGPLLTSAYAWAITGSIQAGDVTLGVVFGLIALLYFHAANFENIMVDFQAGARTWATRAGFDASKIFFTLVGSACVFATVAHIYLVEANYLLLPASFVQVLIVSQATKHVGRLTSPLSSELVGLRMRAVALSWVTAVFLCLPYMWSA